MSKIIGLRGDTLPEAPATPGITRYLAFEGEDHIVVHSKAAPGAVTTWHHHGDYEVYGFILAGSELFEYGLMGKEAVLVKRGDFFHIPPHTCTGMSIPPLTNGRRRSCSSVGVVRWSSTWTGQIKPETCLVRINSALPDIAVDDGNIEE